MPIPRFYGALLAWHKARFRQMAFLAGPRQVGKTLTASVRGAAYFTWDAARDRRLIAAGGEELASSLGLRRGEAKRPRLDVVFDELHKFRNWKRFLKGFFDLYESSASLVVTGSSRLDVYRRGGDSMMGRYFLYHMHPLSVAELLGQALPTRPGQGPRRLPEAQYQRLWAHGGFPEPFLRRSAAFTRRWRAARAVQLVREDIRETTLIQHLAELERLLALLETRSSLQVSYRSLSGDLGVSEPTVKRWMGSLENLHHGFLLSPWHRNIARALRKEPKWFLRDWSGIADQGQRAETFVACHLLKAVDAWQDLGLGAFSLHYVRDLEKREVDFVVVRDGRPWLLAEVKSSERKVSPHLRYYAGRLKPAHAIQVVMDAPYEDVDAFKLKAPAWVPARSFLSQLV